MIDLESLPQGYRNVCNRCNQELRAATLRDLAQARGEHVAECCLSWPELHPHLLKVMCEHPDNEAEAQRICMALVCRIGENAGNQLYHSARAELESQRGIIERKVLLGTFAANPAEAQANVLLQLSGSIAALAAKMDQLAKGQPPVVNVSVPPQAPPVIENRIELPASEPPIVNVNIPKREAVKKQLVFKHDKDGRIVGAELGG